VYAVIEDVEDRVGARVIWRKIIRTEDEQFPSGYRYSLHYGYTDGRGTILRYDNENHTPGRNQKHTPDRIEETEFPGMVKLRTRFLEKIEEEL
jgi:hypothetical protein